MRLLRIPLAVVMTVLFVGCRERVVESAYDSPDSDTCRIHGRVREQSVAPIVYGYPRTDPKAFVQAQQRKFPNSWRELHGGCEQILVPGHESPLQGPVMHCPRCRAAEDRWHRQHEKSSANKPAAGNASFASQLAIGCLWPGVPEPERSA